MNARSIAGSLLGGVLLTVAVPTRAVTQDSLRISPAALRAAQLAGLPLRIESIFQRVERVNVVNMIPQVQSNETNQDSEPNLAVNPANPARIVGSAFTPDPAGGTTQAPVFVSTDRGNTWALRNILPSGNGLTGDISLDFAWRGAVLYTGILRGGSNFRQMILRSADPFAGTMTTLVDRNTNVFDQPYVTALTTAVSGSDVDRVYVAFNNFGGRTANGGNGQTASMDFSLNAATAAPPAGFTVQALEVRNTAGQDMPAVRFSAHSSGVIYGVFYRWTGGNFPNAVCDVVVVRDDTFATGATPFAALDDPSDNLAGRLVVTGRTIPAFPAFLGQNRLVASNLSIAVNPGNAADVWVAWADRVGTTDYTLHLRRSTDSGGDWGTADLLTITNATNPALAVNAGGIVGFLYQALTGTAPNQRWVTHLRRSADGTTWSDLVLADTPDNTPAPTFQPYIGDYVDLIAVEQSFFGIFSASNVPNLTNFPQGVRYQRNADFTTNQLRNVGNTANVGTSIDPFFFRVEPGLVFDICTVAPRVCRPPQLDRDILRIVVDTFPVRVVDPIPRNCTLKWNCPGCEGGLCPGFYHIYFDDLDPADWKVDVVNRRGEQVSQRIARTGSGIVVSFRPSKDNFRERDIGDYFLTFETIRPVERGPKTFRTRLEVSPYPQREHLRRAAAGR